jgi:hypothetical protein
LAIWQMLVDTGGFQSVGYQSVGYQSAGFQSGKGLRAQGARNRFRHRPMVRDPQNALDPFDLS